MGFLLYQGLPDPDSECAWGTQVTTFMLCLIVKARPSKTDPYNTAMILSHAITLCATGLVLPWPENVAPGNQSVITADD